MKTYNHIAFNKPYMTGNELSYIEDAVRSGKISGNGKYTKLCQEFFQEKFNFGKCLLTTSCTDALEMASILINIKPGDEVIMPSYTFVSTSNAFILRGAKIVFVDSTKESPNIDVSKIEQLITKKTKAIVPVHYAGVACDMDEIMRLSEKYNLYVIEDAAQAINSYYTNNKGETKALGSIGHFSTFSFHETKNIISGEGGMLVVNDKKFKDRAEIIWEKGTNRNAFFRGEVDKYGWVDIGSSFLPSDLIAAFLWAQLEKLEDIQQKRKSIWNLYFNELNDYCQENDIIIHKIPKHKTNNAHIFYLVFNSLKERNSMIKKLNNKKVNAVFHYLSLHKSEFYKNHYNGEELPWCDFYSNTLLRLPLYFELTNEEIKTITSIIKND
ncbi:dTDP-4-amino-4,6-dideoxygalactose transaminase [Polaribacter sp. KT 15]|uniref:dTDP-4-amino-4,6-dideoxygalactose transaminase n=1 Tax=Polaribacter sp. KT 15 TaxID=1896175 RepID=UPI00090AA94F|nr:dTDP-4-amino-4,6-dideoxygalactose transaminase [Polaribacter sp. KT 15]SHN09847.1 dTDP-4-amino-4,6-dideoxygalactose transaminase [Polaribacter sp. KT 15]